VGGSHFCTLVALEAQERKKWEGGKVLLPYKFHSLGTKGGWITPGGVDSWSLGRGREIG